MKRRFTLVWFMQMLLSLILSASIVVSAADVTQPEDRSGTSNGAVIVSYYNARYSSNNVSTEVSKYITVKVDSTPDGSHDYYVKLNDTTYLFYLSSFEDTIVGNINAILNNEDAVNKINDITGNLGIKADTDTASKMTSGAVPVVNTALGFMVVIATIMMFIFTALDVIWIISPSFQDATAENASNGGIMKSNSQKKQIRFVSREAQYAVNQATIENGKNPLIIYGYKRLIAHMVLAALIVILLTGNLNVFTGMAISLAQGVIDMLAGIK